MQLTTLPAEALAPIRARFIDALRDREARVGAAALDARLDAPDQLLEDIHKIRGVAPMLGMAELGALAAVAEDRLEPWLAATTDAALGLSEVTAAMPHELHCTLKELHAAIRQVLD